jgi:hypothetical protein
MDTIIEFVGLCVLTTQLVSGTATTGGGNVTARLTPQTQTINRRVVINQRVVVAIMPRVSDNNIIQPIPSALSLPPQKPATTSAPKAAPAVPMSGLTVEAHTAMIAYDSMYQISSNGWKAQTLSPTLNPGWVYIKLSGEKITFLSDTTDSDINTPDHLLLPHLGHTLTSPYTAASNYSGAAAVFTISNGTLSACQNPDSLEGAPGRIDTKLTLHTVKKLTITTASGDKSVTLKAGAQVIAGNVPIAFAQLRTVSTNAHMHYMVYCAMIGESPCAGPWPIPVPTPTTDPLLQCGSVAFRQSNGSNPPPKVAEDDFACSNTQWP